MSLEFATHTIIKVFKCFSSLVAPIPAQAGGATHQAHEFLQLNFILTVPHLFLNNNKLYFGTQVRDRPASKNLIFFLGGQGSHIQEYHL